MLARVRFESLTGDRLQLYVLADPAPGNDGNDDRGVSGNKELVAYDDDAATVVAATPDLRRTTSGYRGSESDPWLALQAMNHLRPFDARGSPATSCRPPRPRSTERAARR